MRRIAHLSDLHFGRIDPRVVEGLLADLWALKPDLIVVSGDLTQRARRRQFAAARPFLDALPTRTLVVPGNHDLPVFNLFRRFTDPYANYRRYISDDFSPVYSDNEIAVVGINTARTLILNFAEGRINRTQLGRIRAAFRHLPPEVFKIVFTHHPFLPPPDSPGTRLVGRAAMALKALEETGVDLLLAGHLHRGYVGDIMSHHSMVARSILVAQASTATSTRLRAEPNAYNFITVALPTVQFVVRSWEGARFEPGLTELYEKVDNRWILRRRDPGLSPAAWREYDHIQS